MSGVDGVVVDVDDDGLLMLVLILLLLCFAEDLLDLSVAVAVFELIFFSFHGAYFLLAWCCVFSPLCWCLRCVPALCSRKTTSNHVISIAPLNG